MIDEIVTTIEDEVSIHRFGIYFVYLIAFYIINHCYQSIITKFYIHGKCQMIIAVTLHLFNP